MVALMDVRGKQPSCAMCLASVATERESKPLPVVLIGRFNDC
jgi:hypothetical protein